MASLDPGKRTAREIDLSLSRVSFIVSAMRSLVRNLPMSLDIEVTLGTVLMPAPTEDP
jgi:hypothetical protein